MNDFWIDAPIYLTLFSNEGVILLNGDYYVNDKDYSSLEIKFTDLNDAYKEYERRFGIIPQEIKDEFEYAVLEWQNESEINDNGELDLTGVADV